MSVTKLNWANLGIFGPFTLLRIPLCDVYLPILRHALPNLFENQPSLGTRTTCTIKVALQAEGDRERLETLLAFLREHPVVSRSRSLDPQFGAELAAVYAIDRNFKEPAGGEYTAVGLLQRNARAQDRESLRQIAAQMTAAIRAHPGLTSADVIAAVPGNPSKAFHLPDALLHEIGAQLSRGVGLRLRKIEDTPQLKGTSIEEKAQVLAKAFRLEEDVHGREVLLIDDVCQSGTTMSSVAKLIRDAGASRATGLVAVKTWRDDDNVPR